MITARINISRFSTRETIDRKKSAMAEVLLRQCQDRIRNGGDDDYRFPSLDFPRVDGSTSNPLYHTGRHILASLNKFVRAGLLGVGTNFIGGRVQQLGTVGKGGELPSIRPKNAAALYFPIKGGKVIAAQKVDIRPRKFLRISRAGWLELVQTFIRS